MFYAVEYVEGGKKEVGVDGIFITMVSPLPIYNSTSPTTTSDTGGCISSPQAITKKGPSPTTPRQSSRIASRIATRVATKKQIAATAPAAAVASPPAAPPGGTKQMNQTLKEKKRKAQGENARRDDDAGLLSLPNSMNQISSESTTRKRTKQTLLAPRHVLLKYTEKQVPKLPPRPPTKKAVSRESTPKVAAAPKVAAGVAQTLLQKKHSPPAMATNLPATKSTERSSISSNPVTTCTPSTPSKNMVASRLGAPSEESSTTVQQVKEAAIR
jgi:hypothetical protein